MQVTRHISNKREREREKETERQTDRKTERETERERGREKICTKIKVKEKFVIKISTTVSNAINLALPFANNKKYILMAAKHCLRKFSLTEQNECAFQFVFSLVADLHFNASIL